MKNLGKGIALGFALGLVLSDVASGVDSGKTPVVGLALSAILILGISVEFFRVRRYESHNKPLNEAFTNNT